MAQHHVPSSPRAKLMAKLIEGVRPLEKHAHACGGGNISVVTNMVWMYGATWGPTLRLCCDG